MKVRSQFSSLKSVPSLAQRAPSSITLRFVQGKPSVYHLCTVVLRQLSARWSLVPKAAEPARAYCNRGQYHKKDPAE
jgi:hypothetical protein